MKVTIVSGAEVNSCTGTRCQSRGTVLVQNRLGSINHSVVSFGSVKCYRFGFIATMVRGLRFRSLHRMLPLPYCHRSSYALIDEEICDLKD